MPALSDTELARRNATDVLVRRLRDRTAEIAVIGQGYVGLPLAAAFAAAGFIVTGIDVDAARVAALQRGESHSPDVDASALGRLIAAGRYGATGDFAVLTRADAVVICVPTPLRKSKDPDISMLVAATKEVARHVRRGQVIVLESTTYPGTTDELVLPMLQGEWLRAGEDIFVAFSPERLDPGNSEFRIGDVPKLIGGVTPACTHIAALLYRQVIADVREVSSPTVAELAKLHENTFRAVNIALANELALICRRLGVSVWEVIEAAASKPFGFMPFWPGPGIGGHCIPVDPLYLSWKARLKGYEARFIALADAVNRAMPDVVLGLLADALNTRGKAVKDARILVLGVAYKRGIGDVRDCPATDIVEALLERGADVQYADPFVPTFTVGASTLHATTVTTELLRWTDAVLIVTDHREFDYKTVVTEAPLVLDTRHATRDLRVPPGRVVTL